jgi:hypothetical protein
MLTGLFMLVTTATGDVARTGYEDTEARPNGIRGELGIASPIGIIGCTFWHDIVPPVRFEGGIGLGVSGVQLSALSRFVLGNEHHRFVPGIGLSIGVPVGDPVFRDRHGGSAVVMPWLNADLLGYEYSSDRGWTTLVAGGVTLPLRDAHWDALGDLGRNVHPLRDWYPELHVGFGKSF